ncbi:hypothetical protein M8C21_001077 [Ambrosia artemisiifolia]|uniref:Uncharacterized protein n=1 Tax=Ambrosia artemisiifolia TaxID=4212 RepID=A0AAD5G4L6_AMBAR|nr:hypothetical protein M8C21_001077 [Ambrosia artemisiifolia]
MAGTIPGVESARRRRFHGGSDSSFTMYSGYRSTRSMCFYDTRLSTTSFLVKQTCMINHSGHDMLGGVARKAKERLDERLRSHRKSEINSSQERSRGASLVKEFERKPSSSMVVRDLQIEVFGLKRSVSKKFNWGKMGSIWKSSEQDECVVCLEMFKVGEKLDLMKLVVESCNELVMLESIVN